MSSEYGTLTQHMIDHGPAITSKIDDTTKLIPILIATATLLAMVSLRNSDIASRYRANTKDFLDKNAGRRRKILLLTQNTIFLVRYFITSASFIVLSFAMLCFAVIGVSIYNINIYNDMTPFLRFLYSKMSILLNIEDAFSFDSGVRMVFLGIATLVLEFLIGWITLLIDGISFIYNDNKNRANNDSIHAITHSTSTS